MIIEKLKKWEKMRTEELFNLNFYLKDSDLLVNFIAFSFRKTAVSRPVGMWFSGMRFSTQVFEHAKIINGVTLMLITDFITLWSRQVTYSRPNWRRKLGNARIFNSNWWNYSASLTFSCDEKKRIRLAGFNMIWYELSTIRQELTFSDHPVHIARDYSFDAYIRVHIFTSDNDVSLVCGSDDFRKRKWRQKMTVRIKIDASHTGKCSVELYMAGKIIDGRYFMLN